MNGRLSLQYLFASAFVGLHQPRTISTLIVFRECHLDSPFFMDCNFGPSFLIQNAPLTNNQSTHSLKKKHQPIGLIKNVPSNHSVVLLANSYQSNFWSFFSQLAQSSNKQRTHGSIAPALGEKQLIIFPSQGQGSRNVRMVVKVEWFL